MDDVMPDTFPDTVPDATMPHSDDHSEDDAASAATTVPGLPVDVAKDGGDNSPDALAQAHPVTSESPGIPLTDTTGSMNVLCPGDEHFGRMNGSCCDELIDSGPQAPLRQQSRERSRRRGLTIRPVSSHASAASNGVFTGPLFFTSHIASVGEMCFTAMAEGGARRYTPSPTPCVGCISLLFYAVSTGPRMTNLSPSLQIH